jgi:predicted membrane-bound dolichyl-phosphate-mannose-protein mannosyltransferase
MKKFLIILPILIYLLVVSYTQEQIFTYRFDRSLIDRYFLSQDIPYEVAGKRLFLSDGEIHQAAGYLYWQGYDPAVINFQHPPLLKYLFGLGIVLFNNPFIIQILLGIALLILTYFFGVMVFKSAWIGVGASFLLAIDPLMSLVSSQALLDLGQAVFILAYILLMISKKDSIVWPGIVLGLIAASKFWAAALFFIMLMFVFRLVDGLKSKVIRQFVLQFLMAFVTLCVVYLPSFIYQVGLFNIIFFELKTLKYWFNHSTSSVPFASLLMFLSGYFRTWWDDSIIKTPSWNILWPISFLFSSYTGIAMFWKKKMVDKKVLITLIPICYLIYLGIQAPFERYYIIILPFLYLGLAQFIMSCWRFLCHKKFLISKILRLISI